MLKLLVIFTLAVPILGEISPFIVGGQNAAPGQFPHMASLRAVANPEGHGCGGGIINNRWILTAAHCLIRGTPLNIFAVVGLVRLSEGTRYDLLRVVQHPLYIPNIPPFYTSNWHDIGLVQTRIQIAFSQFTQPIPLGRRRIIGNIPAVMAGFGAYDPRIDINFPPENLTMSERLQYMHTTIITHDECSRRASFFAAINPNYLIRPIIHPTSHICTLSSRGVGLCFGDSGSLLIANGQAVGVVVSGVRVCAQDHRAPDIYARISSYIGWIEGHVN